MTEEYSMRLCLYLGRLELDAFQAKNSFARYMVFRDALDSVSRSGLLPEESKLARKVLSIRADDTRPSNIGCASGEAGEAD